MKNWLRKSSVMSLLIISLSTGLPIVEAIEGVRQQPDKQTDISTTEQTDAQADMRVSDTEEVATSDKESTTEAELVSTNESISGTRDSDDKLTETLDQEQETVEESAEKTTLSKGRSSVEVASWADFVQALSDEVVSVIVLTADLKVTSKATVKRDIQIIGQGHTIDFVRQTLVIEEAKVVLDGLELRGDNASRVAMLTGTGEIAVHNSLNVNETNGAAIIDMPQAKLTFINADVTVNMGTKQGFIVKNLVVQGSTMTVNSPYFLKTTAQEGGVTSSDSQWHIQLANTGLNGAFFAIGSQGKLFFDKGTTFQLDLKKITISGRNNTYSLFELNNEVEVELQGSITGQTADGVIFKLTKNNSAINISGPAAVIEIDDAKDSFLRSSAIGHKLSVRNGAKLVYNLTGERVAASNAIHTSQGHASIEVTTGSVFKINKTEGGAVAVYLEKNKNNVLVDGGSDFIIYNKGNGRSSSQTASTNHAMMYYGAGGDQGAFTVKDENSSIDITADFGSAITTRYTENTVTASAGTYFIARGNPEKSSGVIRSRAINFDMDGLKYFDFKHVGRGRAINTYHDWSKFSTKNSDLSLWDSGVDVDGNPSSMWENLELSVTGSYLNKNLVTNTPEFVKGFKGMTEYSRITANNQLPIVKEMRIPTDADKKGFVTTLVPEGKYDEMRPAYENELNLTLQEVGTEGEVRQEAHGTVLPYDSPAYEEDGDARFSGMVQVTFEDFLRKESRLKVVKGSRGGINGGEKEIPLEFIQAEELVRDVTPPDVTVVDNHESVSIFSKAVSGQLPEPGYVTLYTSGKKQQSETVQTDEDGRFTVPMIPGLQEGDRLYVAGKDLAGKPAGVINPPITNDSQGNEQPLTNFSYHDRDFTQATEIILVGGELTLASAPKQLNFGKHQVSGKTLVLYPETDKSLIVSDTRVPKLREEWALLLNVSEPFMAKASSIDLTPGLTYTTRQKEQKELSDQAVVIEQMTHEREGELDLSEKWGTAEGFALTVPIEIQRIGVYSGKLNWTLQKSIPNKEEN